MGVDVEVGPGHRYLQEGGDPPSLLYVYRDMLRTGYLDVGGALHKPSPGWAQRLLALGQVYSSGGASIHAG